MKKNWGLIIGGGIAYLLIAVLVGYFIITPGVTKLKEANNIKDLTQEEKTKLIDEVNQKYIDLENQINTKYKPNVEQINQKYLDLEAKIKQKYDNLENEIKEKYSSEEKKLNKSISDNDYALNKEFMANGFSKKYYTLSEKRSELQKEKAELESKKIKEIWDNDSLEEEEIRNNDTNKRNELKSVENNKKAELMRMNENKSSEIKAINNQDTNKTTIKSKGILRIIAGIIIIIIPFIYIILVFNRLTHLSNSVKEKWSQVDVLLKQRADLIPNIVEAVKGASTHEKNTLTNVTKARNQVIKATTKEEEIEANKNLSSVINRLFILQEDYPELKTNTNFISLQQNLKELENNISRSRQIYNKAVLKYKNKLEMFPSNIIANIFSFEPELFFEADDEDKENPNIKFN